MAGAGQERGRVGRIVLGAALATALLSYDFLLFGALSPVLSRQFFAGVGEREGLILALVTFAAGFAMPPIGALFFGRMGDRRGRKGAFLESLVLMAGATLLMGLLPGIGTAGFLSPLLLVVLRLLQGLVFGGTYAGAVILAAEHAPPGRRGAMTGFIQTATGAGLFLSLVTVFVLRQGLGEALVEAWAWRAPFLLSLLLLPLAFWMRRALPESPVFQEAPQKAAAFDRHVLERGLIVFFGVMAPYGALWYTAHFYSQFFLDRLVGLGGAAADGLMLLVAGVGIFEYVFFGWLSDKVGRKRVVLPAMALSVAALFPFFQMMTEALNPQILEAGARAPVIVAADPATCSFEFDPVGARRFLSSCDLARGALAARGIGFQREALPKGALALVTIGDRLVPGVEARGLSGRALQEAVADFDARLSDVLDAAGYPLSADPSGRGLPFAVVALLFLVTFANAVAAPSAAMLTELFPTALRYRGTALSWHMGVGWFGAFLPAAATALVADTGDIDAGLWYPFAVGLVGVFVLLFFMPETRGIALQEVALGGREEPERRAEKGDAR